jgi:hypothetical protein
VRYRLKDEERRELLERIENLRRDRDDLRNERDRLLKMIEGQADSVHQLTDGAGPVSRTADRNALRSIL